MRVEGLAKKPSWVVDKERSRRVAAAETVWLFGLHAVRDALMNPARDKRHLVVTKNAEDKLADAIAAAGLTPEIADPRKFPAPLDPGSVHQGAALEVKPLDWGRLEDVALADGPAAPRLVLLDQVTDPHNVGAILRSAVALAADAVVTTERHAPEEGSVLAKSASGALDMVRHVRVKNMARFVTEMREAGFQAVALDSEGPARLEETDLGEKVLLVLGSEGKGVRQGVREACDALARLDMPGAIASLNVSNAAVLALYVTRGKMGL